VALMDREAKVQADTNQLKADREALEREYAPLKEAREVGKTSKLKAIEKAFGWTLDDLNNEYLGSLEGSLTPQQIAERAAVRKVEELRQADAQRVEDERKANQTREEQENWGRVEACAGKLNAAFAELSAELEETRYTIEQAASGIGQGVTPLQIITWWSKGHNGELPTDPHATLRAYEAALRESIGKRGYVKPAPTPAVVPPAEPEKRTGPTVRVKTSPTITSDDGGEVPIRPNVPRKETATERVKRLVAERAARATAATN
jgi:hypothetical protein